MSTVCRTANASTAGYADTLNAQGQSVPMELGTRVNKVQPKPANPQVQSVQFFLIRS